MKQRSLLQLLCVLLAVVLLVGCSAKPEIPTETTEATEPAPTTPPNGNPNDATCLGSYSATDAEVRSAANTVVATIGEKKLTVSQLQIYYWMEVAAYRQSDAEVDPDYTQSLDIQSCPIDDTVASWQQYFLKRALNTWHVHQSLMLRAEKEGVPKEDVYDPDQEKHQEYMTDKPAYKYHSAHFDSYQPNSMHQAYLDTIPQTLETLAADNGFSTSQAQAEAIAGAGVTAEDLEHYTHLTNFAYMYFTEMGYHFEPTAEEVEAFYTQNEASYAKQGFSKDGEKAISIRHILLIPKDADVSDDGTVTCSEEAWEDCLSRAKTVINDWKQAVRKTKYAQYAISDPAEARFAEAAYRKSSDEGSRTNGGLYVNIRKGQLVEPLDAWCFDPARQHGDYEIIRSDCGYHVVFFSEATGDWYAAAEADLVQQMGLDLVKDAKAAYPASIHYSDIKLGQAPDNGSFVTAGDLLYPDIAHERFPEMPLYLQQDYPEAPFGDYKVTTHGCGITTLAMVASYMADDELTPAELAARYGYYCGLRGSEMILFDDPPAEMGFYPRGRSYNWNELDAALDNGQVVVSLQWAGYWTGGGHYIAITQRTEDGKYVVRDSNLLNYKRIKAHQEDAHTRTSINGANQCFWIYEPKVTRIPACVRCSADLTAGAPAILFREDYHCPKCTNAMARRDAYLSSCAQ